jgi:pyruvate kinase
LINAGCRIFRINFSHGNIDLWKEWTYNLREVSSSLGVDCVLIADLRGRSIRFASPIDAKTYSAGQTFYIVRHDGRGGDVPSVDSPEFFEAVSENDVLVSDDGRGLMRVLKKESDKIMVQALNGLTVRRGKSLVIRNKEIPIPNYLSHCVDQALDAVRLGADYLGLSFVTSPRDILAVREFLDKNGSDIGLIAKIETISAVANVEEIAKASDAVLVARGDLGMHFPLEEVPRLQEKIVGTVTAIGKPVIVATQLLGSMISEPVPSRSEIVDVMNCVVDGVDVLMLTGETAIGSYPVEAVKWLRRIIEAYEGDVRARREVSRDRLVDRFALGVVELRVQVR